MKKRIVQIALLVAGLAIALCAYFFAGAPAMVWDLLDPRTRVSRERWDNTLVYRATQGYTDESGRFVQHGFDRWYTRQGTLRRERQYVDGLPHGPRREWCPQGRLTEESLYDRGRKHGTCRRFHGAGEVEHIEHCRGKPTGLYLNLLHGAPRMSGKLHDGVPDGELMVYDPPGVLYVKVTWQDGVAVREDYFQPRRPGVQLCPGGWAR